jgi:hypothetical protein
MPLEGPRLRLLLRRYCHLCEEMEAAIAPLLAQAGIGLERVDVDEDPALDARYGWDIPLLLNGEQVLSKHRLDAAAFAAFLAEARGAAR